MCICMRIHVCAYIYIYIEREREIIYIYIHIYIYTSQCVCADMQQNSVVSIATLSTRLVKNFLPQNRKDVRLKSSRGQDLCQSPYTGLLMGIHMIVHMNVYDQAV